MQSGKIITLSVYLMIVFNLLVAFGAVWSFQRMNPEIKQIYERNVVSLSACEEMLAVLAHAEVDAAAFRAALGKAESNITESGERETLGRIGGIFREVEAGRGDLRALLVAEIVKVTDFNRQAIIQSAREAQKHRQAGAWGIVFLTLLFFGAALFFEQRLRRTLLQPLQEIAQVLEARHRGDRFRRCSLPGASADVGKILQGINSLLDRRN